MSQQYASTEQLIRQYIKDVSTIRDLLKEGGVDIASLKLAVLESSMNTALALLQTKQIKEESAQLAEATD